MNSIFQFNDIDMSDQTIDPELKEKLTRNWEKIRRRLLEDFSTLRREDLDFLPGGEEALLGRIERRIGKSRQELETLINNYEE